MARVTGQALHRDQLGSVRAVTTHLPLVSGAAISTLRREAVIYKPFGEMTEVLQPTQVNAEQKGWIGQRYDADAGLQYLNARYYDPDYGFFLQPDWFEVTAAGVGTNRYSYSFNDPVNMRDPGGNEYKSTYNVYPYFNYDYTTENSLLRALNNTSAEIGNIPSSVGNIVADAIFGAGNLVAPHAGTIENAAMTTPTAFDDVAAVAIRGWTRLSIEVATNSRRGLEIAYQQTNHIETFSVTGAKILSEAAGVKIRTIDDLASAIKSGQVSAGEIGVEYVERNGVRVIADTRTSVALQRAGIDPSDWNWVNKTGDELTENRVSSAMERNGLETPSSGLNNGN